MNNEDITKRIIEGSLIGKISDYKACNFTYGGFNFDDDIDENNIEEGIKKKIEEINEDIKRKYSTEWAIDYINKEYAINCYEIHNVWNVDDLVIIEGHEDIIIYNKISKKLTELTTR